MDAGRAVARAELRKLCNKYVSDPFSLVAGTYIDVKMRRVVFERGAEGWREVIDTGDDGLGLGYETIQAASQIAGHAGVSVQGQKEGLRVGLEIIAKPSPKESSLGCRRIEGLRIGCLEKNALSLPKPQRPLCGSACT